MANGGTNIARLPLMPCGRNSGVDRSAAARKLPHYRRIIDGPADLIARVNFDPPRRQAGTGDRSLSSRERQPAFWVCDADPAGYDANFGDLLRDVDTNVKLGALDAGSDVRRFDIERPAARAEQFDDPAGEVEQRLTRPPRLPNAQRRVLIEADHLPRVLEAKGRSAPWPDNDNLTGAEVRIRPGRRRRDRPLRRPKDRNVTFYRNEAASGNVTSGLACRAEGAKADTDYQAENNASARASGRRAHHKPPTNQPAHPQLQRCAANGRLC